MAEIPAMTADAAGQQRTTVVSTITASSLMVLMLGVGLAEASILLGGGLSVVIAKTLKPPICRVFRLMGGDGLEPPTSFL